MKPYINKFPEIAALSPQEQLDLLEQARVKAFVELKLSGMSALYMFGSLLVSFLPVVISLWYFQDLSYLTIAISALSIALHLCINHHLQAKLLRTGLGAVLSQSAV